MKNLFLIFISVSVMLFSCELVEDSIDNLADGLSEAEVIEGLKKALTIGADSASTVLSLVDGYYNGNAILALIPLPDEVESIRNIINNNGLISNISKTIGLDDQFDNVILAVNRAAEDAAKEVSPIFVDAITSLSISQGFDILNGVTPSANKSIQSFDSIAATNYLKLQTFDLLVNLYAPKINTSLDKELVFGASANDVWATFITTYNTLISNVNNIPFVSVSDYGLPNAIEADLGEFSTGIALDELFKKVGEEEKKIRKNPFQWGIDILEKVFGSLFN